MRGKAEWQVYTPDLEHHSGSQWALDGHDTRIPNTTFAKVEAGRLAWGFYLPART